MTADVSAAVAVLDSRRKELDVLAMAICDALATRLGPANRNIEIDSEGERIELLIECHGDAWCHLGYFSPDEARVVLATIRGLPCSDSVATEDAALRALGLTRAQYDDPARLR